MFSPTSVTGQSIAIPPIDSMASNSVKMDLENMDLWEQFHQYTNEMILTKPGRRMFPTLRFNVSGLDPSAMYAFYVIFFPMDKYRYKFQNGQWSVNGESEMSECAPTTLTYHHPDSPASGRMWMHQPVSFHRIKLTNSLKTPGEMVLLNSMQKYQPHLFAVKLRNMSNFQIVAEYAPPETQFVSVTAYQNNLITKLKVKYNPFAKGFRRNDTDSMGGKFEFGKASERSRKRKITDTTYSDDVDRTTSRTPPMIQPIVNPAFLALDMIGARNALANAFSAMGYSQPSNPLVYPMPIRPFIPIPTLDTIWWPNIPGIMNTVRFTSY